jgi:hypothetical protein
LSDVYGKPDISLQPHNNHAGNAHATDKPNFQTTKLSYGAMYNGDNSAAAPLHASTLKH